MIETHREQRASEFARPRSCSRDQARSSPIVRCGLGGTAMDTFGVKFQGLVSVATGVERAAGEMASDEPPRNATSMPYVPNLSACVPTKLTGDSGVVPAVASHDKKLLAVQDIGDPRRI